MRTEIRADLVEGLDDPRFDVVGVKVVQRQQAGNHAVLGQAPHKIRVEAGNDPLEAVAVHADQQTDQFLCGGGGLSVNRPQLTEEPFDPFADFPGAYFAGASVGTS